MTSTLGSGGRPWSKMTEAPRVQLPHEPQDADDETTEPLFHIPEPPESNEPGRARVTVVHFASNEVAIVPPSGYGLPIRLTSFGSSTDETVDVPTAHGRPREAEVPMPMRADRAASADGQQQAIESTRARLAKSRRTRGQAFLDGLGRVFGLQPPRRSVPTIEEALLEAMVQLDEASRTVRAEERSDSQLPR